MRQTPDIAVSAASGTPGYFIECTFDNTTQDCAAKGDNPAVTPIGGTSAASPSFTGFVAILNQAVGSRLGNINPKLYELAAAGMTPSPFHDITVGSNALVCGAAANDSGVVPEGGYPDSGCGEAGLIGYNATPGYDCATGIGSIDGYNLVTAWLGGVPTTVSVAASPTTATDGQPVTLTATVSATGGTTPVGGIVTFAFQAFDNFGNLYETWELGSTTITNGTDASGIATLSAIVPVGLLRPGHQTANVMAVYGGDLGHLSSTSTPVVLTYAPVSFAVVPPTATVAPKGKMEFTTTGGVAPVQWSINIDTTATFSMDAGYQASQFGDAGAFTAGPKAGYVEVAAVDNGGATALAYVTVGSPSGHAPWDMDGGVYFKAVDGGPDANPVFDASVIDTGAPCTARPPGHDAGQSTSTQASSTALSSTTSTTPVASSAPPSSSSSEGPHDAGHHDAGTGAGDGGGCGCELVGSPTPAPLRGAGFGVFVGVVLLARRRRSGS